MIHNGNALNILALETATNACSVAVWRNGKIAAQLTLRRTRMHDAQLVPMIGDALRYAGIAAADLAAVAVSSGPGSYTGLRIGTATAKGLAEATGAQLVSVPGPEAWAHLALPLAVPDDHIVAAFDARRNEAYAAAFLVTPGSALETLRETSVIQVEEAAEWLGNPAKGRLYIVGDGQTKLCAQLAQRHGANGHAPEILAPDDERIAPASVAVARLGAAKFERGEVEDIASFEPHYLKEFAAAVPEKTAFQKLAI